ARTPNVPDGQHHPRRPPLPGRGLRGGGRAARRALLASRVAHPQPGQARPGDEDRHRQGGRAPVPQADLLHRRDRGREVRLPAAQGHRLPPRLLRAQRARDRRQRRHVSSGDVRVQAAV
ncbi:MAG: hypothetical protein AVDCRST_MAG53-3405, partial [uncultured Solirubrobacteraceae bacterium]